MPAEEKKDLWSSKEYQHAASFVPKLASKIVQWLDPKEDDTILDIGCGDGVLSLEIAQKVSRLYGIDSSAAMIAAAEERAKALAESGTSVQFEVSDATDLLAWHGRHPDVRFGKVFSNAALHWILRPADTRRDVFAGVRSVLADGGTLAFEMGGLGNVSEMRAALLMAVGRRVGLARAREVDPWFFPDEAWVTDLLESQVGGFRVEKVEREWRPTTADAGGVEAWVRLMGRSFFEGLPEEEREEAIREVVGVLEVVCAKPGGGYMFSYVRLRVLARKISD